MVAPLLRRAGWAGWSLECTHEVVCFEQLGLGHSRGALGAHFVAPFRPNRSLELEGGENTVGGDLCCPCAWHGYGLVSGRAVWMVVVLCVTSVIAWRLEKRLHGMFVGLFSFGTGLASAC